MGPRGLLEINPHGLPARIFDDQSDIEVIATARDGVEAVESALQHRPDVCLFDIRMPRMDGVEATRRILASPEGESIAVIIIIITFDTDDNIREALQAGARGFLLKESGPEILTQAQDQSRDRRGAAHQP